MLRRAGPSLAHRLRLVFADSERRPAGRALRLGLALAALVAASMGGVPICPSVLLLRAPCPGCGLTRAAIALASGDLAGAMRMNPLAPLVCPVAAAVAAYNAYSYVATGRTRLASPWTTRLCLPLALALVAVWIARTFGAFGGPVPV